MFCRKFSELKPEYQSAVLAKERQRMLDNRNDLIARCGIKIADECWWSKLDYINSWQFDPEYLFIVCEECGCPTYLMECISDMPAEYQQRKVTYACKCGEWHTIYA